MNVTAATTRRERSAHIMPDVSTSNATIVLRQSHKAADIAIGSRRQGGASTNGASVGGAHPDVGRCRPRQEGWHPQMASSHIRGIVLQPQVLAWAVPLEAALCPRFLLPASGAAVLE